MVEEIKILLGDTSSNYTDAQIELYYQMALAEIEEYCKREVDKTLEIIAKRITVINLNRINSEGLSSQSYSGVSESYINGYPSDIVAILNSKRKIKVI
ncbi:MAG: phage head-tail connector protein [Bacilli bacterium]|nr:phage head-tail connector protein [Bacilli bacterium]